MVIVLGQGTIRHNKRHSSQRSFPTLLAAWTIAHWGNIMMDTNIPVTAPCWIGSRIERYYFMHLGIIIFGFFVERAPRENYSGGNVHSLFTIAISKMPNLLGATWDSLDCLDIPWCSLKQLETSWQRLRKMPKQSQAVSSEFKTVHQVAPSKLGILLMMSRGYLHSST